MELSDSDRRLLRLLQRDARMSNQDLADACSMSASACWRRVKALEAAGLITGYIAELNAEAVGLGFGAIVHVRLERHDRAHLDQFIDQAARRPEVLELFTTTGEADYHLRVVCADKNAYNGFLENFLLRLPGIAQVRTNLILKEIKSTSVLPI